MPYIEQNDIAAVIPPIILTQALDDDGNGEADAWSVVAGAAQREVDAILGARFTVPFTDPIPAMVREAAFTFACEAIYLRRGIHGKENPFTERARSLREALAKVAAGTMPLSPTSSRERPSASIITTPAGTAGSGLIV